MRYYTDGFVLGRNPSQEGGGFTVVDENNNLLRHTVVERANFTNNEAEILGINEASLICGIGDSISTDSMCCISWASRGRSKSRPDLNLLFGQIKERIKEKKINLMWERRNFNLAGIYNEKRGL